MLYTNKENLVQMLKEQANQKMLSSDRRRRLDGRLELETLKVVADLLPEECKYLTTANGNIRADYYALNCPLSNIHIFNNNTTYIQSNSKETWTYVVVIKATYQKVIKVRTKYVLNYRLTLREILDLVEDGLAKTYESLEAALQ